MDRRFAKPFIVRRARLSLAISLAAAGLLCSLPAQEAMAACTVNLQTVTCVDTTLSTYSSIVDNLTVNVAPGAWVYSSTGNDLFLGGKNITFNNDGMVGPTQLASLADFSSAVVIDNSYNSIVRITNGSGGIVRAIGDSQVGNMPSLTGLAFEVRNGANGTVNFTNNGTIDSTPLAAYSSVAAADIPTVAIYNQMDTGEGAGPKVNFTNAPGATITGRIAFQGSSQGNTFINGGTLIGSLAMGTRSLTPNTFIAVTGSTVQAGAGTASTRGVTGQPLSFAAAGIVDGGVYGVASNNNTLRLQNNADATTTGTGSAGSGTISSATYINFPNLKVISGTWTILGPLLGSYATPTVNLTGGITSVNDSRVFGSATVISNGGELRSLDPTVNLANTITLHPNGLTVSGSNQLTLSGKLQGNGTLTKSGSSTLVLSNATNDYSGGTVLSGGTLSLTNDQAIGYWGLSVTGASTLQLTAPMTLENDITLGSALSVNGGSNTVTLSGDITGTGSLTKLGTGNLILRGANTFSGGLVLDGGTVTLGKLGVLGSGTISLTRDTTLSHNIVNVSLGNNIVLGTRALTLNNFTDITLSGVVSGTTGSLIVAGGARLNLVNANTFAGGVELRNGSSLMIGSDGALGTGRLTVSAGSSLQTNAARTLANAMSLGGNVTVAGSNDLTLSGSINGSAGFTKNGSGTLTLSGSNSYQGGVALNAGTLLVGNHGALGSGTLTTAAATTLGATGTGVTLTNLVNLNGDLTLNGPNNLSLSGVVSGTGNLIKNGSNSVQLAAANTFQGNTLLNAGTLYLGNAGALSQGSLIVNAGTIDSLSAVAIGNAITLNGAMTVGGSSNMTLQGVIEGSGSLVKGGAASLTLTGVNAYTGGTRLNGGTLVLGNANAIGAGDLTVGGGATLATTSAMTLDNALHLNAGLTLAGNDNLTLDGVVGGTGALLKNGVGTLTLNGINTYGGGTFLNDGGLVLGNANAIGSGALQIGGPASLSSTASIALANAITLDADLTVTGHSDLILDGVIDGSAGLVKSGSGTLTLNSANLYSGGTILKAGTLMLGNADAIGSGALNVAAVTTLGNSAAFTLNNAIVLGSDLTLDSSSNLNLGGDISGAGNLVKTGSADLTLSGTNTFNGALSILAGSVTTLGSSALGTTSEITVASGAGLNLGGNSNTGRLNGTGAITLGSGSTFTVGTGTADSLFGGVLAGAGSLAKAGSGTLELSGASSLNGNTRIDAGTLKVSGSLASAQVQVNSGATLKGGGTLTGLVSVADGGHLALQSGSQMSVGSLILNNASNLDVGLGAPATGSNALIHVGGNLTLDGKLNVSNIGGFGEGVYRLIDYTGLLADNGLDLATLPGTVAAEDVTLQTSIGNQVNLVIGRASNVMFWDGNATSSDGSIQGGSGTWDSSTSNWTTQDGTGNRNWNGKLAVFQGAAGNVVVNGTQSVTGLQFVTDGYTLGGTGQLQLVNNGTTTNVRVDSGVTATLDVALAGNGQLNKTDAGTLVLNGANTYTGGTRLNGGTLVISGSPFAATTVLGTGALTTADGTTLDNKTFARLDNDITTQGRLNLGGSSALTLKGTISGGGSLVKNGAGSLDLDGVNTYSGGTVINGGNLGLANARSLGTGDVSFTGTTTLHTSTAMTLNQDVDVSGFLNLSGMNDLTLAGVLSGNGMLAKGGQSDLILSGNNTFTGEIGITSGALRTTGSTGLGNATVFLNWGGSLVLGGNTQLGQLVGFGNVDIGAHTLSVDRGSFQGVLSGNGTLNKVGSGNLALFGNAGHTGNTVVSGGTLYVSGTLASTTVQVDSGASLGGGGSLSGSVAVANGGNLLLSAGDTLSVGSLVLNDTSNLNAALGAASLTDPVMVAVSGDLTLDGKLNVTDTGGFGPGVYRLLSYGGTLTNNGLVVNTLPGSTAAEDVSVQTSVSHQVNLVVGAPSNLLFWDGSQTVADGAIEGGTGVWDTSSSNWTRADGNTNKAWNNTFAVFQGTAGTVTIDGSQTIAGLQFASDGYLLTGGDLLTTGSTNVRVDSGSTATIDSAIKGTGSLIKLDNGTLVLGGSNTYAGGTTIIGGSVIGNTTSLQGAIVNNAALVFEQDANGSYAGNLTGTGSLTKNGNGQLLLTGNNGLTGITSVNAGSLINNGTLASSVVNVASGASLGGSGVYSGSVNLADGATLLAGSATAPLSVGNLSLASGSNLDFALGAPSASTTLVNVAGNLTLDGTLNITDAGGFGPGVYQLFTYGGSLVNNGLAYGSLPGGTALADLTLQTAIANQINLVVNGAALQFWNGSKNSADGTVGGSDGVWGSDTNWTNSSGTSSSDWGRAFAVFGGERGTVTVVGQQSFGGLQFLTDGYQLVAGSSGTLDVNNANDGSQAVVRVNANAIATISAPLVGSGGIEKLDSGTLVLTGANTYSGGTTVSGGTLVGNTTSLQGDIFNSARVVFQQNASGTFVGNLSGSGELVKQGAGDLLLTDNHSFDGTVELTEGSLTIGNAESDAAAASRSVARFARAMSLFAAPTTASVLNAQVNVARGATLAGTGSVAAVVNNGTVAVGGTTGSLTVTGDYTNASNGTLAVTLTPTATHYLSVGGTANLGGSLQVSGLGSYTGDAQYTLISAAGGINGTFASNNLTNMAFIDSSLTYGANDVTLDVARNGVSFASVAQTDNQRAVAQALDNASAPASLRNAVLSADAASAAAGFELLTGEIFASTATVLIEDSRYIRDAVNDRMRQANCSDAQDPRRTLAPTGNEQSTGSTCDGGGTGWIRALGGWGTFDGSSNAAKVDRDLSGFLLGFDNNLDDQWRLGVATGYSSSSIKAKAADQDASVDSYHLATYLSYQMDAFAARLGAGYTWHDIDSKRNLEGGGYSERLKAGYKARTAQVFGEVGYAINAAGVALEPFAGLAWVDHQSDKAHEKGGIAALQASSDQSTAFSTVGVRVGKSFSLGNDMTLTPRGSLGWRHAFGDTTPDADLRFVDGGPSFSNQGVAIARNAAVVEAGVDLGIGQNGKLGVGYSGQLASESRDHALTVSFSLGF